MIEVGGQSAAHGLDTQVDPLDRRRKTKLVRSLSEQGSHVARESPRVDTGDVHKVADQTVRDHGVTADMGDLSGGVRGACSLSPQ